MDSKKMKKRLIESALAIGCVMSITACSVAGVSGDTSASENDVSQNQVVYLQGDEYAFDIRPQDDYYGYINAQDLWEMQVPYGSSSTGTFEQVMKLVEDQTTDLIYDVVSSNTVYESGSSEDIIQKSYRLVKSGNFTDKTLFDEAFAKIDSIENIEDYMEVTADFSYNYGLTGMFTFSIAEDIYNPSSNALVLVNEDLIIGSLKDVYESDDEACGFRNNICNMMIGYGLDYDTAVDKANALTYFWLEIAAETDFDSQESNDIDASIHPYTIDELKELYSNVDIVAYIEKLGFSESDLNKIGTICVTDPMQAAEINNKLTDENVELLKDYLKCELVNTYSDYAPEEYLYNTPMYEDVDEELVLSIVKNLCYMEIGDLYKEKYYTDEIDDYMHRMEEDIKGAYIEMIEDADWLSEEARSSFIDKFNNITFYFGGGERIINIDKANAIEESDSLLELAIKMDALYNKNTADEFFDEIDNSKWAMAASEVNAYYDVTANSIYITTAIMNAPFFDASRDYYCNLGALGVVVCHELSHAFDSNGVKFDYLGAYNPDWISDADNEAFQERVDMVDAHYDEYALLEVYHVDGEQTVAENLADIGGMQCILSLADSKEEYINIFESYGKVWCTLYQNENLIFYLEEDVHSPDIIRINAVLSCFDEFYETYDVVEGDGMYIAPENRVTRW